MFSVFSPRPLLTELAFGMFFPLQDNFSSISPTTSTVISLKEIFFAIEFVVKLL